MKISVVGISSQNSLEYIEKAFSLLNDEGSFVNLAASDNPEVKEGLEITEVFKVSNSYGWYSGVSYKPIKSDSIAQVSYTSGTEGKPKGVMISHSSLANTTQRLIDIMGMDSSIREYIGVPINFSFGFGRCRAVSAVGGAFFLPEHGFNPLEISQMLEADEINAVSAVPSLWRLVLESPEVFSETAAKVLWIEIGSQYMSASEKRQLRELFFNAKIIQHYGLTEASRSTFLDVQGVSEEHLGSVGKAFQEVEASISAEGCIRVRGPHTANSLLIDGKVQSATDDSGWFVTNDGGHIKDGFLYFDGRQDDVINFGGMKFSPDALETSICQLLDIEQGKFAIFKTPHETLGEQISIAILHDSGLTAKQVCSALYSSITEYGLKANKTFPVHLIDQFPVTVTGKVKRKDLTALFSQNSLGDGAEKKQNVSDTAGTSLTKSLISIWEDVLKIKPISSQDSFFDVGGDSLSAIRVTLRMEKAGLPKDVCRKIFEGYSIQGLVSSLDLKVENTAQSKSVDALGVVSGNFGKADELVKIWKDVLKIDSVTESDSFFDLGGDSLSAIRVVVRMEAAGIPKQVCRKIFEGHTIRDIIQSSIPIAEIEQSVEGGKKSHELIKIWQDVLKIDKVTENDSFFDLGGDSLSAIRVVVRMEAAGIPKEVCRKIFEGHTIGDIIESSVPGVSVAQSLLGNEKSHELIKIWQDVLKIEKVTENDSFFDLGGDSLSAIRVVVRMESAGIPKDTCRKIFEGHSIRSLVADFKETSGNIVSPESDGKNEHLASARVTDGNNSKLKRTPIASANLSLNVIRGLLVLMNIAAHWMPGVIVRLPSLAAEVNKFLAPVYSSGTPGFAMVFGAGLSFFILPRYRKNKASVNKLCIRNAMLLGGGISFLAVIVIAARYFNGENLSPVDISNSFYSVLFYYFFAVISIPLWLRILTWKGNYAVSCLVLSCFFYACHLYIDYLNIPPSKNPFVQTGILILTPKYNYLEMSAAVMLGAAVGKWINSLVLGKESINPVLSLGVLLVVLSIFISFETGEYVYWFVWPKGLYLWTWPFYMGCILIGFFYFYRYIEQHDVDTHPILGFVLRMVSVVGIMAFPLFIGHELVRPFAFLLQAFAIPGSMAISLVMFFAYSAFLLRKLYTLYYGKAD